MRSPAGYLECGSARRSGVFDPPGKVLDVVGPESAALVRSPGRKVPENRAKVDLFEEPLVGPPIHQGHEGLLHVPRVSPEGRECCEQCFHGGTRQVRKGQAAHQQVDSGAPELREDRANVAHVRR